MRTARRISTSINLNLKLVQQTQTQTRSRFALPPAFTYRQTHTTVHEKILPSPSQQAFNETHPQTTTTTTTSTSQRPKSTSSIMPVNAIDFPELQACLTSNAEWAARVSKDEPHFFEKSAKGQKPFLLWIGCADSRVPESVVLGRKPGEIFVHRNIANQYQAGDDSAQAVLEYAVGFLGVRHVAIVGHTACGGCAAAYMSKPEDAGNKETTTSLARFLQPLIDLRHSLPEGASMDDLIVENVKRGVVDVAKSEVIQKQWAKAAEEGSEPVYVHGWLKDLSTGLIKDLLCSQGPDKA
ncbi:carbonic anhydrase [Filobasidium floriforme]|uniref:carbonic anhydrase n=1 Tax=Filobasidium floriforme TaxID=5210 RepID=UPI001E8E7106|nr:carbonic anhydrase [Filobasidium floriforme]KAH8083009.1 carbonic anhydrase [Filobasidium floriforme]